MKTIRCLSACLFLVLLVLVSLAKLSRILFSSDISRYYALLVANPTTTTGSSTMIEASNRTDGRLWLNNMIVLHLGKAGGGTLLDRTIAWKVIPRAWCHPHPCSERWVDNNNNDGNKTVFVTIRDPVDRFYSAFNWGALVVCRPWKNETRHMSYGTIFYDADNHCKIQPERYRLHHEEYHNNANELAEALCDDDNDGGEKARTDIRKVSHMGNTLADWIPEGSYDRPSNHLVALVQEPGFDYVAQMDGGLRYAVAMNNNNDASRDNEKLASDRYESARAAAGQQLLPGNNKRQHSSQKSNTYNQTRAKHLSPLGACCATRYFREDYELLRLLETSACRGDEAATCRKALQSIHNRRKVFLEDTASSCRDIVNNNNDG